MSSSSPLLSVEHLTVAFRTGDRMVTVVNDVSFDIAAGETLALVGESGSGKSATALAIMRLLPPSGLISGGSVAFQGRHLLDLAETQMQKVRGAGIGFVFQEPITALNPVFTIGSQLVETLEVHGRATGRAARAQAVELLTDVRIPQPERRMREYAHQLSGGLRQRVMIAMALACRPPLLIADEPTSALDATIQAQILDLLRDLKQRYNLAVLLITHDFGVVAETADRVAVMYAGRIVERAPVRALIRRPTHPYTRGLLASVPGGGRQPRAPLRAIEGSIPDLARLSAGCAFAPRCGERMPVCETEPVDIDVAPDHAARCHLITSPEIQHAARRR